MKKRGTSPLQKLGEPRPPAHPSRKRGIRLLSLVLATFLILGAALVYPVWARGYELTHCFSSLIVGLPRAILPSVFSGPDLLSLSWRHPWFLLGLLLVPWVFWRGTLGEDTRVPRLKLGTLVPFTTGPTGIRVWLRDLPGVVRSVALALLMVALAGPVNSLAPQSTEEEGIDLVVVLDLSESMHAVLDNVPEDLQHWIQRRGKALRPERLDVAKAVIRDFISRRKTDRIGIVVFAREAYVLSPPTLDYQLLDSLISRTELGMIEGNRTAIGDAVGVASARLRRSTAKSKALVLLTDGDNNAGKISPEYAAHLATTVGAKLYTIQIGQGDEAVLLDGFDVLGQPHYVRQIGPSTNPQLLKQLADSTGGQAYVASDGSSLHASFHDVLDRLEKTKFAATYANYEDLFRYLLLPGVLLLALDALLRSLVLRRFP